MKILSEDDPAFQFVSLVEDNATALEVYAGRADQRLTLDTPGAGSGDSAGVQSDTEWAMDGLVDDRNSVVQLVSCLAAVPMGLWEQTVGVVLQGSRNRTEKLVQALDAVPEQRHFEGDLADEVARQLRAQAINQVRRTEEPAAVRNCNSRRSRRDRLGTTPSIRQQQDRPATPSRERAPDRKTREQSLAGAMR